MRAHTVASTAPADRVWALAARPERWSEWSPHVAGAEGLGSPEVRAGASGTVVLRGGLRLKAKITEVRPGRAWTWRVGGLSVRHEVEPAGPGCRLRFQVEAPSRAWRAAAIAYSPLVAVISRNLIRIAEREQQT